jgi:hypothetical protein
MSMKVPANPESLTVAQRAHNDRVIVITDLITNRVVYHPPERVDEAGDSSNRCDG